MEILEIVLALAVSMLLFSTMASMVVEIVHRTIRIRKKGLHKMLTSFYENEVKQDMSNLMNKGSAVEDVTAFINKITLKSGDSTVTTMEFIRRFAETDIGRSIGRRADKDVDVLIDEAAERYEEYGTQASQLFRKYSALINVIVSVLLAFALNINIINIYNAMQKNETLTQELALHAEQAMTVYELRAAQDTSQAYESQEALKNDIKELKDTVRETQKIGLPIGWNNGLIFGDNITSANVALWIFSTLMTGLLIGLGGPFWYDVVKRLTPITRLAGAMMRPSARKGEGQKDSNDSGAKEDQPETVEDHRAAFKKVIKARHVIDGVNNKTDKLLGPRALRL